MGSNEDTSNSDGANKIGLGETLTNHDKSLSDELEEILSSQADFNELSRMFETWFETLLGHPDSDSWEIFFNLFENEEIPEGIIDIILKRILDWSTLVGFDNLEMIVEHPNLGGETLGKIIDPENSDYFLGFKLLANLGDSLPKAAKVTDSVLAKLALLELSGELSSYSANFQCDYRYSIPSEVIREELISLIAIAKNPESAPDELRRIAMNDSLLTCSDSCLEAIAQTREISGLCPGHGVVEVDYELAWNPSTPVDALEKLSRHRNFHVRIAVVTNPVTPPEILEGMFNCEDQHGFRNDEFAGNGFVAYLEDGSWYDGHPGVYAALLFNLNTPSYIRYSILLDIGNHFKSMHSFTQGDFLGWDERLETANLTDLELSELLSLSQDPNVNCSDPVIRELVAQNPRLNEDEINMLINDNSVDVRCAVVFNPNLSLTQYLQLANDKSVEVKKSLLVNSETPVEVLQKLATDEDIVIRANCVAHPNLDESVLMILAEDEDRAILDLVAEHPVTPFSILDKFAEIEDDNIKIRLWRNPNVPPNKTAPNNKWLEVVNKILQSGDSKQRVRLARMQSLPRSIFQTLATDESGEVRARLAMNPACPLYILEKLSLDKDPEVLLSLLNNPIWFQETLSADTLENVSASNSLEVRNKVALIQFLHAESL